MWSAGAPAAGVGVVLLAKKTRHNRRLHCLLEHDSAGDPITGLGWSRRTTTTIASELATLRIAVSANTVAQLLHDMGYSLRVNQKQISTSSHPGRHLQFEYLAELRYRFQCCPLPIISVDSKKRECVGNFKHTPWPSLGICPPPVYDHNFRTHSIGIAIPYGIYDVTENRGTLVVGVSHDTPAFAAHAIAHWWHQEGSSRYRGSRQLLILADSAGSNGCRCYGWTSSHGLPRSPPLPLRDQTDPRSDRCPSITAP